MTSFVYDSFLDQALRGNIDLDTDTFYVMLVDSTYAPNQGADAYRSNATGEVTGAGYAAGGIPVAVTLTKDVANHKNTITLGAVSWPNSTITARRAVYYKRRGGASNVDELIAQDDFGANISSTNTAFSLAATTITFNTPSQP
jgi:hypothetical protein